MDELTREEVIEAIRILRSLPDSVLLRDALHTYYNNYDVEQLIDIIESVVVREEGYDVGDYGI